MPWPGACRTFVAWVGAGSPGGSFPGVTDVLPLGEGENLLGGARVAGPVGLRERGEHPVADDEAGRVGFRLGGRAEAAPAGARLVYGLQEGTVGRDCVGRFLVRAGRRASCSWSANSLQRAMITLAGEAGRLGTRQTDRSAAERLAAIQGRRTSPWVQGTRGRTQAATEMAWAACCGGWPGRSPEPRVGADAPCVVAVAFVRGEADGVAGEPTDRCPDGGRRVRPDRRGRGTRHPGAVTRLAAPVPGPSARTLHSPAWRG